MRKPFGTFVLMLSLLGLSTCSPVGSNNGFNVTLSQNSLLFIGATSASCASINQGIADSSIASTYFQLNNMTIQWTNTQFPLTLQWVEFKATDAGITSGAPFKCQLGGTDLLNAWVQGWNQLCGGVTTPETVTITASTPSATACNVVALSNSCPFKCGGITMTNPGQTTSGAMNLEIYATYDSGGGNLVPLVLNKPLTYFYQGN